MLRQHHEESFAVPDLASAQSPQASEDLVSLVWVMSADKDNESTLSAYIATALRLACNVEFILVNNGSPEGTLLPAVESLKHASIPVTTVQLHTKSPDSVALSTACRAANGQRIATLPPYLQVASDGLVEMIARSESELDFVASVRVPRVDGKTEQAKSMWFNRVVRWASGIDLRDLNSGLKVFRREVIDGIPVYGDLHIYLPVLAAKQGFRVGEVEVKHLEERDGNVGIGLYGRRALDLLTIFFLMRFTQRPFRFFGSIGTSMIAIGFVMNLVMLLQRWVLDKSMADRPMLVLAALLMALGVQVFSLGLLGELIIFAQAGGLKHYRVQEILTDQFEE
ncbi:MAG: glycosyltransferase [Planctomycetales bacterium]|nr:glycosyltransferase [Planctomycetales bacterium]